MLSTDFSYTPCTARTKVGFTQLCYSLVRRYVLKISTMLFLQFHKCFVASFLLIPRKDNRRNIKQFPPRERIMKKKVPPPFCSSGSLCSISISHFRAARKRAAHVRKVSVLLWGKSNPPSSSCMHGVPSSAVVGREGGGLKNGVP